MLSLTHASERADYQRRPRFRHLQRYSRVIVGSLVLAGYIAVALAAAWLVPYDPNTMDARNSLQAPSADHWMGTDQYGRDVVSRIVAGAQISLLVAAAATTIGVVAGTLLGLAAGYFGGWVDTAIMRSMDLVLSFPPTILAIAAVAIIGGGVFNLLLVIGVLYIPRFGRVVYSTTITVSRNQYVESAQAVGASDLRIMRTAILPNILPPILVQISLCVGAAILTESGLSFLGLGAQPPTASWGIMVAEARMFMDLQPWLILWPSVVIAVCVLAANTLGDGLTDLLDPRLRKL